VSSNLAGGEGGYPISPKKKEEKRAFSAPSWFVSSGTSVIMNFKAILQVLMGGGG